MKLVSKSMIRTRTDLLNYLVDIFEYKSYLEIGVQSSANNFDKIKVIHKEGIDPKPKAETEVDYLMTSDEFFGQISPGKKYDLIFIDGVHTEKQVSIDINNSLKHLNKEGTIVIHDCRPLAKKEQEEVTQMGTWVGTAWKSFVRLRMTRKDLNMFVVGIDCGCGVIQRGSQILFPYEEILDWKFYNQNKSRVLKLISVREFKDKMRRVKI